MATNHAFKNLVVLRFCSGRAVLRAGPNIASAPGGSPASQRTSEGLALGPLQVLLGLLVGLLGLGFRIDVGVQRRNRCAKAHAL